MFESILRELIDHVREDHPRDARVELPGVRQHRGLPPIVVGLARFQSYRGRTESALVQELADYIEEAGLSVLHLTVVDDDSEVLVW